MPRIDGYYQGIVMKDGWEQKSLGEVCKIVNGGTPSTAINEYWGNDHLWITPAEMGNLLSPYICDTKRKLSKLGLSKCSATLVPPYSVIMSSRAPIGYLIINSVPISTNQGCKSFIPSSLLYYKFLYYYLVHKTKYIISLGDGATFVEVSSTKLKEVNILFPKINEQHRIASILDTAFDALSQAMVETEKNLLRANELFQSELDFIIHKNFNNYNQNSLKNICSKIGSGATPKGGNDSYKISGIPFIRSMNVYDNYFNNKNLVFIDNQQADKLKNVELKKDDLLLNITGASIVCSIFL
jgi:type I restriction enzyme S subunit